MLDAKEFLRIFEKSFKTNFPDLVRNREVIYVDCIGIKDPDDSHRRYNRHRGVHEKILDGIYESKGLDKVIAQFEGCVDPSKDGKPKLTVAVCKSGRHRAPAVKALGTVALRELIYEGEDKIGCIDLQNQSHWWHMCCYNYGKSWKVHKCNDCDYDRTSSTQPQQIRPGGNRNDVFVKFLEIFRKDRRKDHQDTRV